MPPPLIYLNHPARLDAIKLGLTKFDTGEPCNFGHTSLRYVATGICVQCNDERNRQRRARDGQHRERGPAKKLPTKVLKARAIVEVEKRQEEMTRLPKGAARVLAAYTNSAIRRGNSAYLDSLIRKQV
jgi:hypothetical protein